MSLFSYILVLYKLLELMDLLEVFCDETHLFLYKYIKRLELDVGCKTSSTHIETKTRFITYLTFLFSFVDVVCKLQ